MIRYSGTEYTTNKKTIAKLKRFEAALDKLGIISKTVFIKVQWCFLHKLLLDFRYSILPSQQNLLSL